MKTYEFNVVLTINAENDDEALYAYDQITKSVWCNDSYCSDWKEVENV